MSYSIEFKEKAIKEYRASGCSLNQFCTTLGISPRTLSRWNKETFSRDEENKTFVKVSKIKQTRGKSVLSSGISMCYRDVKFNLPEGMDISCIAQLVEQLSSISGCGLR